MRFLVLLFISMVILSCNADEKSTRKIDDINDKFIIINRDNIVFFYDKEFKLVKCREPFKGLGYTEYIFAQGDVNILKSAASIDDSFFKQSEITFDSLSCKKSQYYFDEFSGEEVVEQFNNRKVTTKIYNYLPKPIDGGVVTSFFDVYEGDTSNFFYYKKEPLGFRIITDTPEFIYNSNLMDSAVIQYANLSDSITFVNPESGFYLPSFQSAQVLTVHNTLFVPFKGNKLVGTYWVFFKNKDKGYPYRFLYFEGDLISRLKDKQKKLKSFSLIKGITIQNIDLSKKLIESGLYTMKNGRLSAPKLVRE